jgi:hypothetical protein
VSETIQVYGREIAVVCPNNRRGPDDVVGCGSTNVERSPDEPGQFDCECGMWFDEAEARAFLEFEIQVAVVGGRVS